MRYIDWKVSFTHIDKNKFSLISQLGFDKEAAFDEVSKYKWNKNNYRRYSFRISCYLCSDSHHPDDIGLFYMKSDVDKLLDYQFFKKYLTERKMKPSQTTYLIY